MGYWAKPEPRSEYQYTEIAQAQFLELEVLYFNFHPFLVSCGTLPSHFLSLGLGNLRFGCVIPLKFLPKLVGHQWLTFVILATQEIEIRKTVI
jgi:hypothetical protein